MQLDELVKKTGAWLQGSGPHCDIVISTACGSPQPGRLSVHQSRNEIEKRGRSKAEPPTRSNGLSWKRI